MNSFGMILLVLIVLLALAFGSFINMLVYRLKHNLSLGGRSKCDYCRHILGPLDLIPVFSYVFSAGKCRHCGAKLPIVYPLVEMGTVGLLLIAFTVSNLYEVQNLQSILQFVILGSVAMTLYFFAIFDYLYWEIDIRVAYFAIALALVVNVINYFYPMSFLGNLWGNLVAASMLAFLILAIRKLTNGAGMGSGDVYLFIFVGLLLGLEGSFLAFILIVWSGAIVGGIKALKIGKLKGTLIQFAPFISLGTAIVLFWREEIFLFLSRILGQFI